MAKAIFLLFALFAVVQAGGSEELIEHEHNDEMGPIFSEEQPEVETENEDDLEVEDEMMESLTADLMTCLETGIKPAIPKGTPLFKAAKQAYGKVKQFSRRFKTRKAFLDWVATPEGKNLRVVKVVSLFRRVKVPSEKCIKKPSCRKAVQNSCRAISRATACNKKVRRGCGIRNGPKIRKTSEKITKVLAKASKKNINTVSNLVRKEMKVLQKLGKASAKHSNNIIKKERKIEKKATESAVKALKQMKPSVSAKQIAEQKKRVDKVTKRMDKVIDNVKKTTENAHNQAKKQVDSVSAAEQKEEENLAKLEKQAEKRLQRQDQILEGQEQKGK